MDDQDVREKILRDVPLADCGHGTAIVDQLLIYHRSAFDGSWILQSISDVPGTYRKINPCPKGCC